MESGVKRKDTTKGPPLRILSLDGGGVRGYSIFIILQEIMHRTFVELEGRAPHRNEIPKPADHFDLIVGTGTGGLIALMLGRLRLNIETCKELYVRMTRLVFETDKTILGIPTRPTLYKASRLEDAIREAVREHTIAVDEGKDSGSAASAASAALGTHALTSPLSSTGPRRHASNASVVSFSARSPTSQMARPIYAYAARGDPNALLYDGRENRTKTVVTALYQGAPRGEEPVMLRSYDSRREPAPEFDCRIWEAGRATCAIGLAFKPIQIGQSVFHDDGAGTFNPSSYALDEATVNEWPGREVGVFISVGTGKRSRGSASDAHANGPMWYDGLLGDYAEARRRLVSKIEGCERVHEHMVREHLPRRGVRPDSYYRLNVEVGVGEFGMNEWDRLADISTNTKRYLARAAERAMVQTAAAKLAKIRRAHDRYAAHEHQHEALLAASLASPLSAPPPASEIFAVELPGDMPATFAPAAPPTSTPPAYYTPRQSYDSGLDHLSLPHASAGSPSPRSSSERVPPNRPPPPPPPPPLPPVEVAGHAVPPATSVGHGNAGGSDDDRLLVAAPTPEQWRAASAATTTKTTTTGPGGSVTTGPEHRRPVPLRTEPPPLPPKTPLPESFNGGGRRPSPAHAHTHVHAHAHAHSHSSSSLSYAKPPLGGAPYPVDDDDAPPPPVDKSRKPVYRRR